MQGRDDGAESEVKRERARAESESSEGGGPGEIREKAGPGLRKWTLSDPDR